ncbi:MAG: GNAT family N-acetyltransferase [Planctomycetota bacterium]|jgi:RimJ/RimL family protein N-acetyltransferase
MIVFETSRLLVRTATEDEPDVQLFLALWNDPRVMRNVGFPRGLGISAVDVRAGIRRNPDGPYDQKLVVVERASGALVGECKLGTPNEDGVSETDVKLRPAWWGRGLGTEVKQGLVDHLFTRTDCRAVRATPNRSNIASQRMQEAVGAKRVDEGVFRAPESERDRGRMVDVPYYVYEVRRDDWRHVRSVSWEA